ncbi:unnamed protein product [Bursaphelenchus xylophilus]|uniref:(pine wood nematode) hypothetical protein n=1 Tax=Bursaphelenchus xylophilus TaxID=6326 RepID=A0A1I7SUB9_BURXY|nr:unnamed protein product [Bursaphelenchus xylophilus]CAG9107316.1 unnamed protein product [Bursaphelenchus xylophilus]
MLLYCRTGRKRRHFSPSSVASLCGSEQMSLLEAKRAAAGFEKGAETADALERRRKKPESGIRAGSPVWSLPLTTVHFRGIERARAATE